MSPEENNRLSIVEGNVEEIKQKLDLVLSALTGNEISKNGGLVEDIRDLKKVTIPTLMRRIEKLESIKNKMIWMAMGAGITGGVGIVKIIQWIQEAAK